MTTLMRTNDVQRLFDDAFSNFFSRNYPETSRGWRPAVDVSEDTDALVFTAELPGFAKGDIDISVEDGVLTLSGERTQERKDEEYHRIERSYGRFERSFTLPRNIDPDKISANLKNGLLVLTLPKREEAKPKQIDIKVK
ncbi:MAG TPA: Hsp20/alpha crystallin family protein [Acidobacteriota bacterium]|nr:Hsp20/alpha crystallin family protein [Acidobacteriota bacterium]